MTVQFVESKQMNRLARLRAQQEEEAVKKMAAKHGVGYVDLSVVPINTDALQVIPEDRARKGGMASFNLLERKVAIAIISPHNPLVKQEVERLKEKKYQPQLFMASQASIKRAWDRYG